MPILRQDLYLRCGVFCAFAVVCLALLPAAQADASSPGSTLGVYRGAGNPGAVAEFESWLGRDVKYALDYLDRSSWAEIESAWVPNQWAGSKYQLVLSVPLLPASGGTLSEGATGAYDSHFVKVAQNLVSAGEGNAVVRLGWEFNGNWYPWSIGSAGGPAAFAAYWRQVVTAMRSVPGTSFKFDWCPARDGSWFGGSQLDPAQAYPGDGYVDYLGMDVYDQDWYEGWQDPLLRWADIQSKPFGLDWLRDFAAAHGKQITLPEWGLVTRPDGHGGDDDAYFIKQMHRWISANDVAYNLYFEFDAADGSHQLMTGQFGQGAAEFRRLFSNDALSTATTVATAPTGRRAKKVKGRVKSASRGAVKVTMQRRHAGHWATVRRARVRLRSGGVFRQTIRGLRRGSYRVRARYVGSKQNLPSTSRYRRFRLSG